MAAGTARPKPAPVSLRRAERGQRLRALVLGCLLPPGLSPLRPPSKVVLCHGWMHAGDCAVPILVSPSWCPKGQLLLAQPGSRPTGDTLRATWCRRQGGGHAAVVAAPGTLSSWRCLETSPLPAGARQTRVTQHGPRGHRQLPQQGRAPAPAAHPGSTHGRPQPLGTDPCRGCATSPQLVAFPVADGKVLAGLGHGVCVPKSRAGHGALKESGSPASPSHRHGAISGPE